MSRSLAAHDAVSRVAVKDNRGVVVEMTGDGMCAAFDDALDATQRHGRTATCVGRTRRRQRLGSLQERAHRARVACCAEDGRGARPRAPRRSRSRDSQGDYAKATRLLSGCLALRRTLADPREIAATLSTLSVLYLRGVTLRKPRMRRGRYRHFSPTGGQARRSHRAAASWPDRRAIGG